jgi:chemotaxis methyl-accepting protein methylase
VTAPLAPGELEAFLRWLSSQSGLHAEAYRPSFVERRVLPRLRATGAGTLGAYLEHLRTHPSERRILMAKLMVATTEFFRNPEVFETLGDLIQARLGGAFREPIRVVSAACSTGQEPVSLAILLAEMGLDFRILALDRHPPSLRILAAGRYAAKALSTLDGALVRRHFDEEAGGTLRLKPALRKRIRAGCCDLTRGIPARGAHVLSCRNVFIYLTEASQARLLEEAAQATVPGGLLVLGRVEGIPRREHHAWRAVARDAKIYARGGEA